MNSPLDHGESRPVGRGPRRVSDMTRTALRRRAAAALALSLVACGEDPKGTSPTASAASTALVASSSPAASASGGPVTPPSASSEPAPAVSGSAIAPSSATANASAAPAPKERPSAIADAGTPAPTTTPTSVAVADAGAPVAPPPTPGSADAVAADLDALYLPKKTFKARFVQKYKQKITGNEKESHGVVFVEKPNKISFRYDPPNQNRIVSDGTSVKVYIADDAQMFEQSVKGTEYPGALSFIMGTGIRSSFSFTFNDKAKFDKGPVLVGKPLAETPSYESALFYVDKDKLEKKDLGAMVAVLILDAQGNRNRFEFSAQETPDKIDPSEFTFSPPPGTTIQK